MAQLVIPNGSNNQEVVVGGSRDHSKLRNLDFESSGHVGFQAALTFDNAPTENSPNPVKSGGVFEALSDKADTSALALKEDAFEDVTVSASSATFDFSNRGNDWVHYSSDAFAVLEIDIPSGVYPYNFKARASFNSPSEIPTSIIYAEDSELINWTGTDCYNWETASIFRPQPEKHYDIDFYFNGAQFVGKVYGYKPATVQNPLIRVASGVPTLSFTNCLDSTSLTHLELKGAVGGVGNPGTLLDSVRTLADKQTGNASTKRILDTSKYYKGIGSGNATVSARYDDTSVTISGNTWTVKGMFSGSYNGYGAAIPISCNPSTKYSIKWAGSPRAYMRWATYQADGTFNEGGVVDSVSYSGKFGVIETHSTAATLVLFLIPGAATANTMSGDVEFSNIMVAEGEYTSATMPEFVPFGKYEIPFTVTTSSGTKSAAITLDQPLKFDQTNPDDLEIIYDQRRAFLLEGGIEPGIDITSQIDWSRLPYVEAGDATITVTSLVLPGQMSAQYYYNGGN